MNQDNYFSIKFVQKDSIKENDKLVFLDQTSLPLEENYIETENYERVAQAIERLEMRGAPLIGIAAAYAMALSIKNSNENLAEQFYSAHKRLAETRPTAVNLFFTLKEMKDIFEKNKVQYTFSQSKKYS